MAQSPLPLALSWAFGFNKGIVGGVHSLCDGSRSAIVFASAHTGVVYDFEARSQLVLQGHCNTITCVAVSQDKKWIVTADQGNDSILVVWDAATGAPARTFFELPGFGITAVAVSPDSLYVATLSAPSVHGVQTVAVWAWADESLDRPIVATEVASGDVQRFICFGEDGDEMMTYGHRHTHFWRWKSGKLEGYRAPMRRKDFPTSGTLTSGVFLPHTTRAASTTTNGDVILWDVASGLTTTGGGMRSVVKAVRLTTAPITLATTVGNFLVLGSEDGAVRFYDFELRIYAWFEDLAAGPVSSISFASPSHPRSQTAKSSQRPPTKITLDVPDFVVGTRDGYVVGVESYIFDEVLPDNRRGTLLVQGMSSAVTAIACNPREPHLVVGCKNGTIQLWDYKLKLLLMVQMLNDATLQPLCFAFCPPHDDLQAALAVGFQTGCVKLLHPQTLEEFYSFQCSSSPITQMQTSPSGEYLAACDEQSFVALWRRNVRPAASSVDSHSVTTEPATEDRPQVDTVMYNYIGRCRAHAGAPAGLAFEDLGHGKEALVSVGQDRHIVEYDLGKSSEQDGVQITSRQQIDDCDVPMAMTWLPRNEGDYEQRIMVATQGFKLKEFNSHTKQCRKISLGPTHGGPVVRLHVLPRTELTSDNPVGQHYLYSTSNRILGMGRLPADGNPTCMLGVIAHPAEISWTCLSSDGSFLFSAGGEDMAVNMWAIDRHAFEARCVLNDISAYYPLLEDEEDGSNLADDLKDYFVYAQVKAQGEDSVEEYRISDRLPLQEIPGIMRALGYFPSERDIANMLDEVKYRDFTTTGELAESISYEDLLKLYINHRPVEPVSREEVMDALHVIAEHLKISSEDLQYRGVPWSDLAQLLTTKGEPFQRSQLRPCLAALVGSSIASVEGGHLTPATLIEDVLCLPEAPTLSVRLADSFSTRSKP